MVFEDAGATFLFDWIVPNPSALDTRAIAGELLAIEFAI